MEAKQDLLNQAVDILVVDDSIASLRMLTEILTKAGYKIRPVEEPQLALEAALAQPPSLILLDVRMPKMSGFEVCRRLKQDERTRDVPVIFVSALEELQDRIQGFEVGGVDFISKPVQELEVLARVKTHLQLRNTQLHLEELVAERTAELGELLAERSAALDSAEDQIRTLFESAQVGIGITTPEGDFRSVSKALLSMTGYSESEIRQLNVLELYLEPAQRSLLLEQLQESEAVHEFGTQILRKDGTFFYASLNVSKLARTGEGVDALLTVIADVTEQVQAETALRDSEQKFRALFQGMPVPAYTWQRRGEDFVLVDHNDAADAITGGAISNYLGITLTTMYPDRPDIVEDISRCFAEKVSFQREIAYSFKSTGEDKTLVVEYAFVPPDLVLVQTDDITERKQAEDALQKSEGLLRAIADNYPSFVTIILKDGQDLIVDFTSGKEFITLNLEPAAYIGKTVEEVFRDQASIVQENYMRAFMGEEVSFESLINDQYRLYNAIPLIDENEAIDRILVVVENITERKLLETQLEQAAAMAERDRLAQDLHDSVTQGLYSASLIAETLPLIWEEAPEAGRRGLKQLERLTQGALAEMRALLLELRPAALVDQELPVLLRQLADATMARTRTIVTTTVVGDCSLPTEVKIVMYRIVQEALNNVVKHAQAGQVWLNLHCDGPRITLRIGDNGLGFDPEALVSPGLGLGTMRERADSIDATLTITSQPDQGTEVLAEWSAS